MNCYGPDGRSLWQQEVAPRQIFNNLGGGLEKRLGGPCLVTNKANDKGEVITSLRGIAL